MHGDDGGGLGLADDKGQNRRLFSSDREGTDRQHTPELQNLV
jgi:hypothetical protein